MIKLGRMIIENFKSFIEPMLFNFTGNDLVLFDGPNGFGKTTIFDAIELCFTGEISRIEKTDNKTKNDHILKGDNSKPSTIHLELLQDDVCILVLGIYIPASISGEDGKISNYHKVIERFEASEWQDDFIESNLRKTALDVSSLKKILGNEKLDSTFTLFNYIQQEETCHFLKLTESKRHEQISHLFGTTDETNNAATLDSLSAKLKEEIGTYTPIITNEEIELAKLSKPAVEVTDDVINLGSGKITVFSNLSSSTVEQLEEYRSNIEGIKWILQHPSGFESLKFNYSLEKMTTLRIDELDNFIKVGSVDNYKKIERLNTQYLFWKNTCVKANNYKEFVRTFDLKPNSLNKETLNQYGVFFKDKYEKFRLDIASFDSLILGNNSCNTLLATIEESRKNLFSHYEIHTGHDKTKEHEDILCPFCGDPKSKWKDLINEYNKQTKRFEEQLGENGKLLATVTTKLIEELVIPLIDKMRRFLIRYEKYINFDFETLNNIKNIEKLDFENMEIVKKWLASNIEGYSSFTDTSLYNVNENYKGVNEQLIALINDRKKPLIEEPPKVYLSFVQDLKALNLSFDKSGILAVDSNDICKDLALLSRLIIQQSSTSYKAKEKLISNLQEKVRKLTLKRTEITAISKVFKDEIKAYEKDVAKHIAIPLFVYSSKILQSRPEGSGIFLITPTTANAKGFMQFSATPNDSHDAWNTMSSGQLAGVVISFMLAMNKVYPSKLSTLMIDDPVQTMDEVNMASFVQMMRYEFPDMQVLLSTHESKVANYFHYKYTEAGLKSLPINMKTKRLGVLIEDT